jgi:hypothetical protein
MGGDAYWFSHDSNARDDQRCVMLIEQLGLEGYGIYWILIETLRDQPGYRYPLALLPSLARRYNTTAEKMRVVVGNYGLFTVTEDEFFLSPGLCRRMERWDEKRELARLKGLRSGEKRRLAAAARAGSELQLNCSSTGVEPQLNHGSTAAEPRLNIEQNRIEQDRTEQDRIEEELETTTLLLQKAGIKIFNDRDIKTIENWLLNYSAEQIEQAIAQSNGDEYVSAVTKKLKEAHDGGPTKRRPGTSICPNSQPDYAQSL